MTKHVPMRPPPPAVADDWALFLDVDGSLVGFDADPSRTTVLPGLVTRLQALSQRLQGALALVSGRRVSMLDRMFAPLRLPAAGLHGLERRHGGDLEMVPFGDAERAALAAVAADAQGLLRAYPGALLEDKGLALGLHWRAHPAAEAGVRTFADDALARLPGYRLQSGDHVLELRPEGADKGTAIARFMQEAPFAGRTPVFIGDDLTDEHGFAVVNSLAGISVLVGDREASVAGCALRDPAAVHRWLGVTE